MKKTLLIISGILGIITMSVYIYIAQSWGLLRSSVENILENNTEIINIRIGVTVPTDNQYVRASVLEALGIITSDLNNLGGINNRKIEIIEADNACEIRTAINSAKYLINKHVSFVIGYMCSTAAVYTMPLYSQAKIPVFSSSATMLELTKSGAYPGFFRTTASDELQGEIQAEFIGHTIGASKVAFFHDHPNNIIGLAKITMQKLKNNTPNITLYNFVLQDQEDHSLIINEINNIDIDTIVYDGSYNKGINFLKQLRTFGYKKSIILANIFKLQSFIEIAQKDAEGVYITSPVSYREMVEFTPQYHEARTKFMSLNYYTYYDFDVFLDIYSAFTIIVQSLQDKDSLQKKERTYQEIIDYISSGVQFQTARGLMSFDKYGDINKANMIVYQVQNRRFMPVGELFSKQ